MPEGTKTSAKARSIEHGPRKLFDCQRPHFERSPAPRCTGLFRAGRPRGAKKKACTGEEVVELIGFEPMTPGLQSPCSPS